MTLGQKENRYSPLGSYFGGISAVHSAPVASCPTRPAREGPVTRGWTYAHNHSMILIYCDKRVFLQHKTILLNRSGVQQQCGSGPLCVAVHNCLLFKHPYPGVLSQSGMRILTEVEQHVCANIGTCLVASPASVFSITSFDGQCASESNLAVLWTRPLPRKKHGNHLPRRDNQTKPQILYLYLLAEEGPPNVPNTCGGSQPLAYFHVCTIIKSSKRLKAVVRSVCF